MIDASEDDNIASLLGAVIGLQALCSALAGALPASLADAVASNLSIVISPLKKELAGMSGGDATIEATLQALEAVHTALLREKGSTPPPSEIPKH